MPAPRRQISQNRILRLNSVFAPSKATRATLPNYRPTKPGGPYTELNPMPRWRGSCDSLSDSVEDHVTAQIAARRRLILP